MAKAQKKKQIVVTRVQTTFSGFPPLESGKHKPNRSGLGMGMGTHHIIDAKYECKCEDVGASKIEMFILYPCLVIFLLGFGFTFLFVSVTGLATIFGR